MHTERTEKLSRDIQLLSKSILKWERLAANSTSDDNIDDCALCTTYYKSMSSGIESCVGCPIRDNTGKQFCKGTPYDAWSKSTYKVDLTVVDRNINKKHATVMCNYLKELQAGLIKQAESDVHVPSNIPPATTTTTVL